MGEAFGYRATHGITGDFSNSGATVAAAGRADSSSDRISKLEQTVNKLSNQIESLVVSPGNSTNRGRINNTNASVHNQRVCFNCSATGHIKRRCNLSSGQGDPDALCQLCNQRGHTATQCKLFLNHHNKDNSGNANSPRNAGRGPLGGQI